MENNFHKAYKEVLEILKYMPIEEVNKIPKDMMETFLKKMDNNHDFQIDINKDLEEQELLEETKDILSVLFRDYWATNKQKEKIIAKENYDMAKLEKQKREKYNPDNIFKNNVSSERKFDKELTEEKNIALAEKKSWYVRVIDFIKSIFKL